MRKIRFYLLFCLLGPVAGGAETYTPAPPDTVVRRYCLPRITGMSPARFITLGWDWQLPYTAEISPLGSYDKGDDTPLAESARIRSTQGLRLSASIPVIAREQAVWQLGFNFWNLHYDAETTLQTPESAGLVAQLNDNGLRTAGLNTTLFKPLGEKQFLILQGAADLSGDYSLNKFQKLRYLRYSVAAVWGKRPHDRLQWGLGLSRTYRAGQANVFPVAMFNWTAPNRKWGTEILLPARAHLRRNFSAKSLLLAGYELEGQSYRIHELSDAERSLEIRRGELRARLEYQRQLSGYIWIALQAGYRFNWSFNADYLPDDGKDFSRGFSGNQPYAMLNTLGNAPYITVSLNLVRY